MPALSTLRQRLAVAMVSVANAPRGWSVLLALLIALVSWLALTPQPPPDISLGWDKLNHMLAFTALGFSACMGCAGEHRACLRWSVALLAFGGLIEVLQLYVPGRSCEWGDLLGDALGIACGASLAFAVLRAAAGKRSG